MILSVQFQNADNPNSTDDGCGGRRSASWPVGYGVAAAQLGFHGVAIWKEGQESKVGVPGRVVLDQISRRSVGPAEARKETVQAR